MGGLVLVLVVDYGSVAKVDYDSLSPGSVDRSVDEDSFDSASWLLIPRDSVIRNRVGGGIGIGSGTRRRRGTESRSGRLIVGGREMSSDNPRSPTLMNMPKDMKSNVR